jgi:hypothetical protein
MVSVRIVLGVNVDGGTFMYLVLLTLAVVLRAGVGVGVGAVVGVEALDGGT